VALARIVTAANNGQHVARVADVPSGVIKGTARSIGSDSGAFARDTEDIRTCCLRVTTEQGWEVFWPIADLLAEIQRGEFVTDYS
jgi:hypothetical protein